MPMQLWGPFEGIQRNSTRALTKLQGLGILGSYLLWSLKFRHGTLFGLRRSPGYTPRPIPVGAEVSHNEGKASRNMLNWHSRLDHSITTTVTTTNCNRCDTSP